MAEPDGRLAGAQLPISVISSLQDALTAGGAALQHARHVACALPYEVLRQPPPVTFGEAVAVVQAREDEKKRQQAKKDKQSKTKASVQAAESFPGAVPGGEPEKSAFWLYMEGYFRDLTQEDVLGVLPRYSSLLDDPVLLVPPLGPEQAAGAATAATPATAAEEADKLAGRKSRRIVARVSKEAEARRIAEEEAAAAAEAQAALAGLTPSGQQANSLLETCTDDELALLADQVVGLRQITHSHEPLSENDPDLQRWLMIGRSSDQNGSNGGLQHISPDMRSKAHVWLRHVAQRAQQAQQGRSTALSQDQPAQQDDLGGAAAARDQRTTALSAAQRDSSAQQQAGTAADGYDGAPPQAVSAATEPMASDRLQESGAEQQQGPAKHQLHMHGGTQMSGLPVWDAEPQAAQPGNGLVGMATPAAQQMPPSNGAIFARLAYPGKPRTAASTAGPPVNPWSQWHMRLVKQVPLPSTDSVLHSDESLHPYTRLLLQHPPTQYVLNPQTTGRHPSRPTMSGPGTPSIMSHSVSENDPSAVADMEADTATGTARNVSFSLPKASLAAPVAAQHPFPATAASSTPAVAAATADSHASGAVERLQAAELGAPGPSTEPTAGSAGAAAGTAPAGMPPPTAQPKQEADLQHTPGFMGTCFQPSSTPALAAEILERQVSSAGAGPSSGGRPAIARQRSSINYSLLAGKKDGARASGLGKAHRKAAKSGGVALCGEQQRPGHSQASSAVAAAVAAGPVEQGPEEQWQQLQDSAALLAAAPDDEILGEILALQSELMQQSAINRGRLEGVLQRAMEDRQRQAAFAEERADAADFVKAYIQRCRAAKRNAKREKREQAQREALAAMSTATPPSPRNATGRARSNALDASQTPADSFSSQQVSGEAFPLQDMLADRSEEEEAMCCVCGGGHSASPNYIVFCERCDIAVHQKCYDLDEIPAGEWLCWPCRRYEDDLRRQGVPQSQIRPPRWEMAGAGGRQLPEGGSRSVQCALCPVAYGAFRQTVDSQEWVHQVCALWQPEVTVRSANACEVVGGKANIKPDRWTDLCSICRRPYGAIIRCNLGHCAAAFHPLCARNAGQYLAVREVVSKATYRAYCSLHSELQRAKDRINLPVGEGVVLTKKDAKKREKEAQARFAELVALTGRESERAVLRSVRLELEALRLLLERMNRREKLKREAARLMRDVHALRLANPAEARALAATRQSEAESRLRSGPGSEPAQPSTLAAAATAAFAYDLPGAEQLLVGSDQLRPRSATGTTFGLDEGFLTLGPDSMANLDQDQGLNQNGKRQREWEDNSAAASALNSAHNSGLLGKGGSPDVDFADLEDLPANARAHSQPPHALEHRQAAAQAGHAVAAAQQWPSGPSGNGGYADLGRVGAAAEKLQVERECMMTSGEAAASNAQLPPGFMYVPANTLGNGSVPPA